MDHFCLHWFSQLIELCSPVLRSLYQFLYISFLTPTQAFGQSQRHYVDMLNDSSDFIAGNQPLILCLQFSTCYISGIKIGMREDQSTNHYSNMTLLRVSLLCVVVLNDSKTTLSSNMRT